MTKDTALRRLENRTAQLARLKLLGAPSLIIENQRRLVSEAGEWVDAPPADIPD